MKSRAKTIKDNRMTAKARREGAVLGDEAGVPPVDTVRSSSRGTGVICRGTGSEEQPPGHPRSAGSHREEMGPNDAPDSDGNRPERPAAGVVLDRPVAVRSPGQRGNTATRVWILVKGRAEQRSTPQNQTTITSRPSVAEG